MKSKVLIAEDQLDLRENLTDFLIMQGYDVLSAANGEEAFKLAVEEQPNIIISDLGMPIWDGARLLSELQKNPDLERIPVVILTSWADRKNMRLGLQAGAVDYITKPFTLDEIAGALDSHLNRQKKRGKAISKYARDSVLPSILRYLPHELRTPMTGILGASDLLMDTNNALQPEDVAEMGEIFQLSSMRILRLIENMEIFLSLKSKSFNSTFKNHEEQTCFNITFLLERICKNAMTRNNFPKTDIIFNCSVAADRGVVIDLEKVFDEVLNNAFQFADSGSSVRVNLQDAGDKGILTIQNEGPGLSPDQLDTIDSFIQFDRNKQEQQGLGLGLYIAKELASLNGASLDIQSCPEGPTIVQITFPLISG